ncbi:MAG: class I SAM-dependent methyltransferase [Pirellulales bacterium]
MSTSEPLRHDPQHAPEEAARWFNQWHVYRSIVDADWMAHRGIFRAIRAWVLVRHPGPFTLVDLGCGDAGFIKSTFDETGLWAYTGVDTSQAALSQAQGELAGARFAVRLLENDLLTFLREDAGIAAQTFDIILASYAVHHLPAREKQEFFRLARGKLPPHGSLLFADVFRRNGESRDEYLDRYVGMMRQAWTGMLPEHVTSTVEHVVQRDFPESGETILGMASEAGFCETSRELFRDATDFHRVLAFTKKG